ncbi:MAG: hypothetical protein K6F00_11495, partial [Lachnospiraceae bacterium]|nr:hypothetical protein [Lachnospiraceae bacterium]
MGSKLIKVFTYNVGLKVIAVLFAVAVWFVVVNVDNPNKSGNFTVPIQIKNQNVLESEGKYISLLGTGAVTFRASAKRSVFDRLTNADFEAVADFSNIEDESRVPIDIYAKTYSKQVTISTKVHYLEVTVSNLQTSKFIIEGDVEGEPSDGYVVSDVSVVPNVITVSGPEEIVSTISYVSAACDVDGLNEDVTLRVVPKCFDADGNEVNATQLTLSENTVKVKASLQSEVEIEIHVETSGKLAEGLSLDSITTDPERISIRGKAKALNKLTAIKIPGSAVNLSNVTKSMSTTVDISEYLPKGISLASGQDSHVNIIIKLKDVSEKSFDVSTSNFTIRNVGEGKSASFIQDTLQVKVTGYEDDLEKLKAEDITGSVDASGLELGEQTVRVEIA